MMGRYTGFEAWRDGRKAAPYRLAGFRSMMTDRLMLIELQTFYAHSEKSITRPVAAMTTTTHFNCRWSGVLQEV